MHTHDHDAEQVGRTVDGAARAEDRSSLASKALEHARPGALDRGAVVHLQASAGNASVSRLLDPGGPDKVRSVLGSGGGEQMDPVVARQMEQRFGEDFSDVRIHRDARASESARAVNANAYTVGRDIVFQSGRYDPSSPGGMRTLAHELTHVVQQRSGPVSGAPIGGGLSVSDPGDRHEREASQNADRLMASASPEPVTAAPAVQRETADPSAVLDPVAQREAAPEEEEAGAGMMAQREAAPEEEEEAGAGMLAQREEAPEEEEAGAGMLAQREGGEEEEETATGMLAQREEAPEEEEAGAGMLAQREAAPEEEEEAASGHIAQREAAPEEEEAGAGMMARA